MLDTNLMFDGVPPSTASGSTTGVAITTSRASTNTIDLLKPRDIGAGSHIGVQVLVTTTFVGGTSMQIQLQASSTAGGTYYPFILSPVYTTAALVAGVRLFQYELPRFQLLEALSAGPLQFLQLYYTVSGTYTAGAIAAWIAPDKDRDEYFTYPANYVG